MKIRIDADEAYPDYFVVNTGGFEIEVSEQEAALIREAEEAYSKAQSLIRQKLEEQGGYDRGIQQW